MADIIQLLPDTVANQIAAGEVVQRPSSVIKELVENSIDAGARRIDVLLQEAGKTSIQVIDDGKGMSEMDARRAFERHATSKIREAADLFSLTTMGFRGEALPSIAAVAQVTLRTRQTDDELGTCLAIEGGRVLSQEVEACPVGCNFLVQNLFFNVPARRRFLKTNQTELANIMHEFERVALVNPNVHFTLTHNASLLLDLPVETMLRRISTLFGKKLSDQLLTVDVDTSLCHITGFVGRPEAARKKGTRQFFFVNGRYMRHPYFHKAVQEAFAGLIPATDQVPYFLMFEVEPSTIDVNIHPTKTEIKFENENAIWQILLAAVREALSRFSAVPQIDFQGGADAIEIPVFGATPDIPSFSAPHTAGGDGFNPFRSASASPRFTAPKNWDTLYADAPRTSVASVPDELLPAEALEELTFAEDVERSTLHYQYCGQYILTAVKSGLMIVEQHRAHIRVLYDKYRAQLDGQTAPTQRLLFPELVQVALADAAWVESVLEDLHTIGLELESLGGGSFSVLGMPVGLEGVVPQTLLDDLLQNLKEGVQTAKEEVQHRLALTLARNAAMPVGQSLNAQEMEGLLQQLFATGNPNYTPDGSIIISILEHRNIEELFR